MPLKAVKFRSRELAMSHVMVFSIGLAALISIVVLILWQFVNDDFQFWPPPSPHSWQKKGFRVLFRIFFVSLIVLTYLDFNTGFTWQYLVGGILSIAGFGFAVHWTGYLGWRDSFGEPTELKTSGPFAWSRNPVYLVSIVGMIGWALFINSLLLTILLGFWATLYLAAPFVEEPWLEREFGEEYQNYKNRTPRYLW